MANKPTCKTCGLEVDDHFITLDDDGRAVAGRYGPDNTEWYCYSELETEKRAIKRERGEILTLLDQLVEVSKIARNSWPEHSEQWFDCNNRYQAYQNAYLRVRARDRQE